VPHRQGHARPSHVRLPASGACTVWLTRTPPEDGGADDGTLPVCELAVRAAPRDSGCGGEAGGGETARQAWKPFAALPHC
jgi:hypothetical protein